LRIFIGDGPRRRFRAISELHRLGETMTRREKARRDANALVEYTGAGDDARLMMLVMHDDAKREYAYGPAQGLPDTKVGTFTQVLYDEAKKQRLVGHQQEE
jgi:hypothetical protein